MDRREISFVEDDLLYVVPHQSHSKEDLLALFRRHPEIKFVSLVGIDLRGNDTDEKIPIKYFLDDIHGFLKKGVQTDGSSVVLPGIATLNNGQVDIIADVSVNWFVDYNYEHIDYETGRPVGTLRIPSFLIHNGKRVDSRSVLQRSIDYFKSEIINMMNKRPEIAKELGIDPDDIEDICLIAATELEFWVKTPDEKAVIEELSTSQVLQEQYWKRTKGDVRTALEKSLLLLERYGLQPEMGHKEVGGVKAKIGGEGRYNHIMEQLEIDWLYAHAMQAADNELIARILVKEVFRMHGLEVTFLAKPIEGVAGSGEHTHVNVVAKLRHGEKVNLFSPADMKKDFLSVIGWGALMGLLKNYEVVSPFITSTNDGFNRLKPGFEAPICIVASIGRDVLTPARNRTVLAGLVRDIDNPKGTRFEVRSPNPHTNTYLALAAMYQAMLDGIKYAVESGKTTKELEKEFTKNVGENADYLEKDRAYRSEENVFEYYNEEQRDKMFGVPPATVWENLKAFRAYPDKTKVLVQGNVFGEEIIRSYEKAICIQWTMELYERILTENMEIVKSCKKIHNENDSTDYDEELWKRINDLRHYMIKDTLSKKSLFTRIRDAIDSHDYDKVSELQLEMSDKITQLKKLYTLYKRNMIEFDCI
ncbi:MAG TPA: glutamine synthetase [Clostridiaceae bacterium]|nr:glutamine synthetase [Clostridiaceae bacterium]